MNFSANEALAAPRSLRDFVDRLVTCMPQLTRAIMRHEENYLSSGHLNLPQAWALELLAEAPLTMHQLSRQLRLKSSTATLFVDRLADEGLVRRRKVPEDRRAVYAELTPKGLRVHRQIRAQKRKGILMLFSPLTARERTQYLALIEKLVRKLDEESAADQRSHP